MNTAIMSSWLLTYLVHSTILLGTAWLVSRALADRRLALQEILLRMALVGGLLTATLQVGFGVQPIGGSLNLDSLSVTEAVASIGVSTAEATVGHGAASITSDSGARADSVWPTALLSFWVIGSLLALSILGRSILDLRRLLRTRRFRPTGRLLDRLATAMGLRRAVRLSTSGAIAVPFATGIRRPEICCPERIDELASEHRKSLFAHELAHLARRDPAWQLIYRLGEALLFLQPLNRLVRRRLEEIAEHLTDERAVACTGNRLGLARCLVVVAHWGLADSPGVPATAFAAGPRLDRRVKRLICGTIGHHRSTRWTAPLLVAMLIGSVLLLPTVMPAAVHANLTPTGSDAAPVETWSPAKPAPEPPATAVPVGVTPASEPLPVVEPFPESLPAPEAVPRAVAVPVASAPPETQAVPASPASPTAPEPPQKSEEPSRAEPGERERAGEKVRERQRQLEREFSEERARARAEARALAAEARELAREVSERSRLTEAEREKLRSEARELMRQAEREARERVRTATEGLTPAEREKLRDEARELMRQAEREARERARLARESSRLSDAQREELRLRAEAVRAAAHEMMREAQREARERARALSEEARRLAEEAEAERLAEEKQRQQEEPE